MIEPVLHPVPIADMRPTQMTIGLREVAAKRKAWRKKGESKDATFLGRHMIPAVIGPKKLPYIIDHHHLALALQEEGVEHALITVVADLGKLDTEQFWFVMDNRSWMYAYDEKGRRCDPGDIPKTLHKMTDDPFRSLAGELRQLGGYAKDLIPYSEFQWADFLRRRMKLKDVENDFKDALDEALKLAKSSDASYLPGWSGPTGQ
jgi:hypothetical protein